jgi:hypothetical protein
VTTGILVEGGVGNSRTVTTSNALGHNSSSSDSSFRSSAASYTLRGNVVPNRNCSCGNPANSDTQRRTTSNRSEVLKQRRMTELSGMRQAMLLSSGRTDGCSCIDLLGRFELDFDAPAIFAGEAVCGGAAVGFGEGAWREGLVSVGPIARVGSDDCGACVAVSTALEDPVMLPAEAGAAAGAVESIAVASIAAAAAVAAADTVSGFFTTPEAYVRQAARSLALTNPVFFTMTMPFGAIMNSAGLSGGTRKYAEKSAKAVLGAPSLRCKHTA